ncbi:MAG TPA: hypothetical protein VH394_15955 [Thermoanaerobaculia bacterium]|jgi:hypothetical protein|nr:hypothetical protein [Thermoanaerobaculia bacterium]
MASVAAWIRALVDGFWGALAAAFAALQGVGPGKTGLAVLLLAVVGALGAWGLQRRLVQLLQADPRRPVRWLSLEAPFTLPGLIWLPFAILITWVRRLAALLGAKKKGKPEKAEEKPEPLLVAALGPSFLLGGLGAAVLYVLARAAGPLLRKRMGLPPGSAVWQEIFLGRPELRPFLPLEQSPWLAGLVAVVVWAMVAWWCARIARLVFYNALGRNLAADREDQGVLPLWRSWMGAPALHRPAPSYSEWSAWVVACAFPLLAWAWLSLSGKPWRVEPGPFAVAFVLWLSWAVHLFLKGVERISAGEAKEEAPAAKANGWPEVLAWLEIAAPEPVEPPRLVEPLQLSGLPPETDGVISPLALELLPEPRRLTGMQRTVLSDLSLQAFVHVDPPARHGELELEGLREEAVRDRSGLRHRNQVVLAPEGTGKTTLALLAAANHALVHTRSTLVVARDDAHEEELWHRFRAAVEPSTVRWNLRVRRAGADLLADLGRGILPDVVVCSLHRLVVQVLGNAESFAPFLKTLGLIVVDDTESFCGPVEVHAQLAFRRLAARLDRLLGLAEMGEPGERSAPQLLVLAADSMHDLPAWAKTLVGADAVTRDFTRSLEEMEERETAERAAKGLAGETKAPEPPKGKHHVVHRLDDLRPAAGEKIEAARLVEACEQLAVPWCYRPCGDRRRRLGRLPLRLAEEPNWSVESPEDACVVLLEGSWSDVRRERLRLRRAGARFRGTSDPGPIALVTLVDPDEEAAFGETGPEAEKLPRPILRPPSGRTVQAHLSADLIQHWLEVAEVVEVFGHASATVLRRLSRGGLLLTDRRTDVHPEVYGYVRKVYVRALARATAPVVGTRAAEPLLALPVAQVERVSPEAVAVRDRTRPAEPLAQVDAGAAGFLYYPGRIFTDARGSFVVVGRAADEVLEDGTPLGRDDVLVEPILGDGLSTPRRRIECRLLGSDPEIRTVAPEPVLLGRFPLQVGLVALEARPRHVATYRLGAARRDVRQRLMRGDDRANALRTAALAVWPNPNLGSGEAPRLTFGGARLLAAALRCLLPSVVRGAAESLEVAIHVEGTPGPDHELGPEEALLVFDLDEGGNGAARALHRDGLEPLLRLCRRLLERIPDPDRLQVLHDHWADEAEILAEASLDEKGGAWEDARRRVLDWLDSRTSL